MKIHFSPTYGGSGVKNVNTCVLGYSFMSVV